MRILAWVLALAALARPAEAFFDAGLSQVLGSNGYVSRRLFADFGDTWHLRPAASFYRIEDVDYRAFSALAAYDTRDWGAGFTVGGLPRTAGYSQRFAGVDAVRSFRPWGEQARRRLDAGASVLRADYSQSGAPESAKVGQTELSFNGGLTVGPGRLSFEYARSLYDQSLEGPAEVLAVSAADTGLDNVIQGFPRQVLYVRGDFHAGRELRPYVSYTRIDFQLDPGTAQAWVMGLSVRMRFLEIGGEYELYLPGGGSSRRNYISLNSRVRFD